MALDPSLLTYWAWFILALVLAALEIAAPGAFMIWLAGASFATGLLTLIFDLDWHWQLVAFAVLAIVSVVRGRAYLRRHPTPSSDALLNRRADRLVGEVVIVIEAIEAGHGRVQVGDSPWLAAGPDMPAGSRARIRSVDGSRVNVEPA